MHSIQKIYVGYILLEYKSRNVAELLEQYLNHLYKEPKLVYINQENDYVMLSKLNISNSEFGYIYNIIKKFYTCCPRKQYLLSVNFEVLRVFLYT